MSFSGSRVFGGSKRFSGFRFLRVQGFERLGCLGFLGFVFLGFRVLSGFIGFRGSFGFQGEGFLGFGVSIKVCYF